MKITIALPGETIKTPDPESRIPLAVNRHQARRQQYSYFIFIGQRREGDISNVRNESVLSQIRYLIDLGSTMAGITLPSMSTT